MNPNSNSKFDRSSDDRMDQALNHYFQSTKPVGLDESFSHDIMSKIASFEKKKENDQWLYGGIAGWVLICVVVNMWTISIYFDALISRFIGCCFVYSNLHHALGQCYEKIGSSRSAEVGSVCFLVFVGGIITFACSAYLWEKTRSPIHRIIK